MSGSAPAGGTLSEADSARILAAVDAGFADQLALTEELVRYPSVRGAEGPAQEAVAGHLTRRGYQVDRWTVDVDEIAGHPAFSPVAVNYDNAINVVGTHRPRQASGRSLILNGHIDVVPAGPLDMWARPPFEPIVEDGWLYGRGSGDMKAGLAANIAAMDALARLGLQPAATVHQQSVCEEECTGNGTLACLVRGYDAEAALVSEPIGDRLVRANVGVLWFRLTVRGRPVHAAVAGAGSNAILSTYRLIEAIYDLAERWNAQAVRHPLFADVPHPINANVGAIEGGDWPSSVPAWCRAEMRLAILPGDDPAERQREIEAAIAAAAAGDPFLADSPPEVTWTGSLRRGYHLEPGSEAEAVLARAHARAFGTPLEPELLTAGLDGVYFSIWQQRPCLTYGPLAENIHGFDERVSLDSLRRVTGAIALFIAEWCGLGPRDGS